MITAIGPMNSVNIPQDALIVQADGDFVMPGFIDVHAHWSGNKKVYN